MGDNLGWLVVRGVQNDLSALFKKFKSTNSVRFEDFASCWREMKFSTIFHGRDSLSELLEFSEELIHIVKNYLSGCFDFQNRIGALYALYSIYFKQPIKGYAKIRMVKSEWADLQALLKQCKDGKHFDAVYIHCKLEWNGAYQHVVTDRPKGLERGYRKYDLKRTDSHNSVQPLPSMREVLPLDKFETLAEIESHYFEMKTELLGDKDLNFVDANETSRMQEKLRRYQEPPGGGHSSSSSGDAEKKGGEDSQKESESIPIGTRRVQLRADQFKRKCGRNKVAESPEKQVKICKMKVVEEFDRGKLQPP